MDKEFEKNVGKASERMFEQMYKDINSFEAGMLFCGADPQEYIHNKSRLALGLLADIFVVYLDDDKEEQFYSDTVKYIKELVEQKREKMKKYAQEAERNLQ